MDDPFDLDISGPTREPGQPRLPPGFYAVRGGLGRNSVNEAAADIFHALVQKLTRAQRPPGDRDNLNLAARTGLAARPCALTGLTWCGLSVALTPPTAMPPPNAVQRQDQ